MNRSLDSLSVRFRPLAVEFLAKLTEAGIIVLIVNTFRTPAEQADAIARGVSWTTHSKHLTGDAIDVCPYDTWTLHGAKKLDWQADDPIWQQIGKIGESVGLKWGGRWTTTPDLGHLEYPTL